MKLVHIGVPTQVVQPGEHYVAPSKMYMTNPEAHPFRFEFLRFEPGSPMQRAVQTEVHVAYQVDSLEAALAGVDEVVVPPFTAHEHLRIAFVRKDGVLLELMEEK